MAREPLKVISIHALLAESDQRYGWLHKNADDFYPRSPCGERRHSHQSHYDPSHFYPRSPCGERPSVVCWHSLRVTFLSTLSLRRATPFCVSVLLIREFLSTLSLRRATRAFAAPLTASRFLSTLSLRRATFVAAVANSGIAYFYPRSPCGERRRSPLILF